MRKIIIKTLVSLIIAALVIFIFELFCGIINKVVHFPHAHIDPGVGGNDVFEYPVFIKDKELFWKFDTSQQGINSFGFRDREVSEKGKDVIRIVCLGDSVTFGPGVRLTYPEILENLLKAYYPGKKIEVLNGGIPGYTSFQGLRLIKNEISNLKPDIVIAFYGINDAGYNTNNKPDKEQIMPSGDVIKILNALRHSQIFKFMLRIELYFKYPFDKLYNTSIVLKIQRVSAQDYRDNNKMMAAVVENTQGKFLLIARPVWYEPSQKRIFAEDDYFPPKNLQYLDLYRILKPIENNGDAYFLHDAMPYYFHFTEEGLKILTEKIFLFLVANKWLEADKVALPGM